MAALGHTPPRSNDVTPGPEQAAVTAWLATLDELGIGQRGRPDTGLSLSIEGDSVVLDGPDGAQLEERLLAVISVSGDDTLARLVPETSLQAASLGG